MAVYGRLRRPRDPAHWPLARHDAQRQSAASARIAFSAAGRRHRDGGQIPPTQSVGIDRNLPLDLTSQLDDNNTACVTKY